MATSTVHEEFDLVEEYLGSGGKVQTAEPGVRVLDSTEHGWCDR
jgi:hypothetical protein